ncbi:hypothetical protein G7046_g4026 [Stylonectria norvegica]|nr:hypothetical protein G7046_g4026 [Stylonectria norvegica]
MFGLAEVPRQRVFDTGLFHDIHVQPPKPPSATVPLASSTWLQAMILCPASLAILSFALFKFIHSSNSIIKTSHTWKHVLCNILTMLSSAACAVLYPLSQENPKSILAVLAATIWAVVVGLRILYILLPAHRSLLNRSSNLLSLTVLISTTAPQFILPFILAASPDTHLNAVSLALVVTTLTAAIFIPIFTPYHSPLPKDATSSHPWASSSPITRWWTYSWVTPFITKSYSLKSNLSVQDLPPLTPHSDPSEWGSVFASVRSDSSTSTAALLRIFYPRLAFMALLMAFCGLSEFLGAIGLRNLLLHLENRQSAATFTPWFSVFLFGVSPVIRGLFMQTFEFFSTDAICHLKGMVISVIYQRILSSKPGSKPDVGQVTNHVSADIDKLATLRYTIMAAFMVPVEVLVASVLLYQTMGWSCLPGIGIMLATRVPISWYFSKFQGMAQSRVMSAIDARVRRVSEAIKGLQTIKMLGQGASFVGWVGDKRQAELHELWRKWFVVALSDSVSNVFVLVPLILSLAMYTLVAKMPLDPSVVFTVLSIFNTLQKMLGLTVIGASTYAQSMVSLERLVAFLDKDIAGAFENDVIPPSTDVPKSTELFGCKDAEILGQTDGGELCPIVSNASITLVRGGLNLIVGKTGSGKSSLIKGLLSELPLACGQASLRFHPSESLSYAPQTPWLQRGTIRDNILFSSPLSLKRYDAVLRATALDLDLESFPEGDLADVGESGTFLSGGQRSRVALARAIYASTRTVILDDVLSALDANTMAWVIENAIFGPLMRNRTVVLVSENEKCRAGANQIIELVHGQVNVMRQERDGALSTEMSKNSDVSISQRSLSASDSSTMFEDEGSDESSQLDDGSPSKKRQGPASPDAGAEAILTGLIGRLAMFKYLGLFGSLPMLLFLCVTLLAAQGFDVASSFWLTIWSSKYSAGDVPVPFYLSIYFAIGMTWILLVTLGTLLLFAGAVRAGATLHSRMLTSMLGATFAFITSTPAGQLMNRFSSDMFSLDNTLPELVKQVVENYLSIIFRVAAVSSMLPAFLLPAMTFLGIGFVTGQVYMYGSTASKRLYAAGLSPILSSITDGISGIEVIRAHGVQADLQSKFMASLEIYLRGWETVSASQRWLAVRMDFLAGLISLSTATLAVMLSSDNPAKVGFSMTSSSALCSALLYAVYLSSIVEVEMNSFQRVSQYIDEIPQEGGSVDGGKLTPPSWPSQGRLEAANLSAGYSLDGEAVLENISLSVHPGKRVAIVGRSGSGKSSLVATILRLAVKHRGSVSIDGLDVEEVDVERLRQAVSFIPQDPTLFEGTLRFNLDFTGTVPDAALQEILSQVVSSNEDERLNGWPLDRLVSSGGSNLSQGERQLIAMARALATNARIVVIDEATASLDLESDRRIQRLLRERFAHKALVAIAHRLDTILDFDEVLVMETGRVVERGCPKTLVVSGEGRFSEMWVASGEGEPGVEDKGGVCTRTDRKCEGYNNPISFRDQTKAVVQRVQSQAAKRRRTNPTPPKLPEAQPSPPAKDASSPPAQEVPIEAGKAAPLSSPAEEVKEVVQIATNAAPPAADRFEIATFLPNPLNETITTSTLDFMIPETPVSDDWSLNWQNWDVSNMTYFPESNSNNLLLSSPQSLLATTAVANSPSTDADTNEAINLDIATLNYFLYPAPSPSISEYSHPAFDAFQFSPDSEYYRYFCNGSVKGFKTIMPIVDLISDDRLASSHLYSAALAVSALSMSALGITAGESLDDSAQVPKPLAKRHALRHYSAALTSLYRAFPSSNPDSFREASLDELLGWLMTRLLLSNLDLRLGSLGAWRAHLRAVGRVISVWHGRISQSSQGKSLIHAFARMALLLELENEDFAVTKQGTMNPCVAAELNSMIEHSTSPRDRLLGLIRSVSRLEIKYRLRPDKSQKWMLKMKSIGSKLSEWQSRLPPSELPVDTGIADPIQYSADEESPLVCLTPLTFPNSSDPYTAAVSYAHFLCARMRSRTRYGLTSELLPPSDAESSILHICRIAAGLDPTGCKQADAYGHGMVPAICGAYRWSSDERIRSWILGWLQGYGGLGAEKGVAYKQWHLIMARIIEEGDEGVGDEGTVWDKVASRADVRVDGAAGLEDEEIERDRPFRVVMYTRSQAGPATQHFLIP